VAELVPGLCVIGLIAAVAQAGATYVGKLVPIPSLVVALGFGMAMHRIAGHPAIEPAARFCMRAVLRWSVALLGLRVAFSDIAALGLGTCAVVVGAMVVTVMSGFVFARWSGRHDGFGALIGVGTAVCGASATLACATVLPEYRTKQADVAFVVVAMNALATVAMLLYPPVCLALGLDPQSSGVMLGGTIHDIAQVVGAGYAISDLTGNTAVVVKLFRVFLLLPTVLAVGWYFGRHGAAHGPVRVPVPVFAIGFLALCMLNSVVPSMPALAAPYAAVKPLALTASAWGMLLAIAALGLLTSLRTFIDLGWRQVAGAFATSGVMFAVVTGSLLLMSAP
jgi:uncharacterized integral membrane protein (TIGR00698 family)